MQGSVKPHPDLQASFKVMATNTTIVTSSRWYTSSVKIHRRTAEPIENTPMFIWMNPLQSHQLSTFRGQFGLYTVSHGHPKNGLTHPNTARIHLSGALSISQLWTGLFLAKGLIVFAVVSVSEWQKHCFVSRWFYMYQNWLLHMIVRQILKYMLWMPVCVCVASFVVSQPSPANPKCYCSTVFSSTGVSAQRDIVSCFRHASTCTILHGFNIMYHGSKRGDSNWSGQILHGSR